MFNSLKSIRLISLIVCILSAFTAQAKVISMSVAEIKGETVTSREVNINLLVEQALYPRKKEVKWPFDLKSKFYVSEVNRVLIERIVSLEGESFSIVKIGKKEVLLAKKELARSLFKKRKWRELQVEDKELRSLLRRKIISKKFIQFKANSSVTPIMDFEVKKYFNDNKNKFGDLPFSQFEENIKTYLKKQQLDDRLKNWLQVLQVKYKVKNLLISNTY
jgi:hypothetical protein